MTVDLAFPQKTERFNRRSRKTKKGAPMVPQRAVLEIQGTYQIAVVDAQNTVEMRRVTPGKRVDDLWLIEEGIKVGETVVVGGLHRVRSGMKVTPTVETEAKAPAK